MRQLVMEAGLTQNLKVKSASKVLHMLIDIVKK